MTGHIQRLKRTILGHFPTLYRRFASPAARARIRLESSAGCIDVIERRSARRIRISQANAVFVADMMNHFDYYFSSAEPVRCMQHGRPAELLDFSVPRYHEIHGFADFPVLCPTITEPFITIEQYLQFACLEPGAVVLDLGTYSGLTAICFSKAVGAEGRIIALEPDPGNFRAASRNIRQHEKVNRLANIVLMDNAIAGSRGKIRFSSEGTMGSSAIAIVGDGRGESIEVEGLTLMDVVSGHGLDRVDFIKMDIEGAEQAVLEGAEEFFQAFRPRLIVEPHLVGGVMSTDAVIRILERNRYDCRVIPQYGVDLPLITAIPAP
jgi:FkbM family methyltransferase